jgi:hypothetical protein
MLFWLIQISVLSFIFIMLVHHLVSFFKSTLTTPKIKDLVYSSNQKYKNIFETLSLQKTEHYTDIDLLPTNELELTQPSNMKDELKTFLKKQLNNNKNDNENIDNFVGMSIDNRTSNFSEF